MTEEMKKAINEFCIREYGEGIDIESFLPCRIPVAYTETEGGFPVEVFYNPIDNTITREVCLAEWSEMRDIKPEDWKYFDFDFLTLGDWR